MADGLLARASIGLTTDALSPGGARLLRAWRNAPRVRALSQPRYLTKARNGSAKRQQPDGTTLLASGDHRYSSAEGTATRPAIILLDSQSATLTTSVK